MWASLDRAGARLEGQPRAVAVLAESVVFFLLFFVLFHPLPAALFTALEEQLHSLRQKQQPLLDAATLLRPQLRRFGPAPP